MRFRLHSLVYLLPQIGRALRTRPQTVRFPFAEAEIPKGYRGLVRIDAEKCRGCGMCVRDCPAFALELERTSRDVFRLIYHPERCAYCGQCELSCPAGAIYQENVYAPSTRRLADLTTVLVDRDEEAP